MHRLSASLRSSDLARLLSPRGNQRLLFEDRRLAATAIVCPLCRSGDVQIVANIPAILLCKCRTCGYGIGDVLRVAIKGDAHELTPFDNPGKQRDAPFYRSKTLVVGPYRFLASGPISGLMEPYRLEGRTLIFCQHARSGPGLRPQEQ
jgi:hypothetical protein